MSNTIILYYSFEGNTEKVAKFLSKELNLESKKIDPVKDLKSKGFSKYLIGGSQVVMKKKPELKALSINLDKYDTVILGSPIWAGSFTPGIRTLLEDGILKGKKVAFFYCHDGGPGRAEEKISQAVSKHNILLSSFSMERVKEDFESLKPSLIKWARGLDKEGGNS